jgi:hypothetical protein
MENALRQDIHDTGNSLSAYIGELDDRIEKLGGAPHS